MTCQQATGTVTASSPRPTSVMSLPALLTQHIARRPQRIALLQHVAEQGSITRAAKAAGISYKAAWDAIDELNNLATQPLVERSTGGRGGGGARLSAEGERVLRLYRRLQTLQAQLLDAAEESSDLDLLGRLMLRTSARNQLQGRISGLRREGRHDRVSLDLGGGLQIEALITRGSTERLELTLDTTVVALLKAGWVQLLLEGDHVEAGSNCLMATVEQVLTDEDGPSEVRLVLGNGQTLCAFADEHWLTQHELDAGSQVRVQFHPSYVLLGFRCNRARAASGQPALPWHLILPPCPEPSCPTLRHPHPRPGHGRRGKPGLSQRCPGAGPQQLREPGLPSGHRRRATADRQVLPPRTLDGRCDPRGTPLQRRAGRMRRTGGSSLLHEGRSLFEHRGFRFTLFPRRGGHAPEPGNLDQLYRLGQLLGRLHAVGAARPFEHRETLAVDNFGHASLNTLLEGNFVPKELRPAFESVAGTCCNGSNASTPAPRMK